MKQGEQERLVHVKALFRKHPVLLNGSCGATDSEDSSLVIFQLEQIWSRFRFRREKAYKCKHKILEFYGIFSRGYGRAKPVVQKTRGG